MIEEVVHVHIVNITLYVFQVDIVFVALAATSHGASFLTILITITFILLLIVYRLLMSRIDAKHGLVDEKHQNEN